MGVSEQSFIPGEKKYSMKHGLSQAQSCQQLLKLMVLFFNPFIHQPRLGCVKTGAFTLRPVLIKD